MSQPADPTSRESEPRKRRSLRLILVLLVLFASCGVLLPLVQTVRDDQRWQYSARSMRKCALAMHNYADDNRHLPPAAIKDQQGHPLYSWRVAILPYIEEDGLYKQFHLDESWDSPHNLTLLAKMPKTFQTPFGSRDALGTTRFQVPVGPGSIFERDGLDLDQIPNGTERTILILESDTPVPWTKPADFNYDPQQPLPSLTTQTKPVRFLGRELWRERGFVLCFADGHTEFIRANSPESIIRARMWRANPEH